VSGSRSTLSIADSESSRDGRRVAADLGGLLQLAGELLAEGLYLALEAGNVLLLLLVSGGVVVPSGMRVAAGRSIVDALSGISSILSWVSRVGSESQRREGEDERRLEMHYYDE